MRRETSIESGNAGLFDHLVGAGEDGLGHRQTERLCGLAAAACGLG
jgi:hypothetical protein